MAKQSAGRAAAQADYDSGTDVPLKDPVLAATLAWLLPGAGHFYQGRRSKAVLFFVCILGTFFYGLYLGEGRVVYASMRQGDQRFANYCQVGVGLPALPALVQAYRVNHGKPAISFPVWNQFMVPPSLDRVPGAANPREPGPHELDKLQKRLNRFFDMGTVYTMIAGLLNVLVIYDAWAGPAESGQAAKKDEEDDAGGGEPPPDSKGK